MSSAKTVRFAPFRRALSRTAIALAAFLSATPGMAFSDTALIDGFRRTVFGSEYPGWGWQSNEVKKFVGPVRVYVDDRSAGHGGREVKRFVRTLSGLIAGVNVKLVSRPQDANFRVFVLDRADYRRVVARDVYGRPSSTFAPGRCLVRVISSSAGISRSDAVVVADEGDRLLRRCTVEEILQGLGPVNDDKTLSESIFNDTSPHTSFTDFDRHLLNMLYHPLVRPGMTKAEADGVLPKVVADVQARLR